VRQWNMFGTGDHVTSILDEGTQDSSPSDVSPFPARWVWKYRMPSVRKGRGQTGEKTYPRPRKQRILVIGDGPLGDRIVAALQRHSSYELVGHLHKQHVADTPDLIGDGQDPSESFARLEQITARERVHRVVVTMTEAGKP